MAIENITEAQKANLVKLYLAYFNRAPETQGLDFHVAAFLADLNAGLSEDQAFANRADNFYQAAIDVPAWSGYSVSMTTAEFVAKMYDNVLLRPGAGGEAPSAEDISYWVEQLESGAVTRGGLITSFLDAVPHLIANGSPEEVAIATQVQTVLDARLAVALEFVKPEYSGSLTGEDAFNAGKNVLVGVVDPDTAADRISELESAANTVTLTEGVDILAGNVFEAPRGWTPGGTDQVNTLNDDDVLTGSGENPTLNFTFVQDSDIGSIVITPTLNDIETVNVAFATQQGVALLDAQDSTGIENVNLSRIAFGNTQAGVRNLGAEATNLSINDSNAPAAQIDLTYLNSALASADDEVNLKLNNVTAGRVIVGPENWTPGVGIETLNLESTGEANQVGQMQVEDLETLIISGDQALELGSEGPTVNKFSGQVEATRYGAGLDAVAGSLGTIDASALEASLSINLGGEVVANQDGTSGKPVDFNFTGTGHDDLVQLLGGLNKGDVFDLGDGDDTVALFQSATGGELNGAENVELRSGHDTGTVAETINFDTSIAPDLEGIVIRNEGQDQIATKWQSASENATFNLDKMTPEVAANVTVLHGTTGNNNVFSTTINAALAADTKSDTVGVTIEDGVNTDPRSNFRLNTSKVENIVLNDEDTESNTVRLANSATVIPAASTAQNTNISEITESITVTGEDQAGNFLNLDYWSTGGAIRNILGLDVSGGDTDTNDALGVFDFGTGNAVRFVGETVDASEYTGDLIVRVAENLAVPTGAQTILGGSGNDHIIFDALNNATAGLSISDTVDGGDGHDILYLDGHGKIVNISASEWTNVSNIEEVHLVGNGQPDSTGNAGQNDAYGKNAYNLTLTNDFIAANGEDVSGGRRIIIDNNNEVWATAGETSTGVAANAGVTIDARSLNAQSSFEYQGRWGDNDGDSDDMTDDRFILSDANINGLAVIDGGALLAGGNAKSNAANNDILEVRNSAVVTIGDLAGIQNVSNIELSNDQAAIQTVVLQLDNETVDRLVNSSQNATSAATAETLTITAFDNPLVAAASTVLNLDTSQLTNQFLNLNVTGGGGNDTIAGGAGNDSIIGGEGADLINLSAGGADQVEIVSLLDGADFGSLASAEADSITGFTTAAGADQDTMIVDAALAATLVANTLGAGNSNTYDFDASNGVFYIDNAVAADLSNFANVAAAIGAVTNETLDDASIFIVQNAAGTATGIYAFTSLIGDDVVAADELALIGIVDNALTDANFAIV